MGGFHQWGVIIPKWLVYFVDNPFWKWMITGAAPISGNLQISEVNMADESYWLAGANRYLPGWRFLFAAAGVLSMTLALLLSFFLSEPPSIRDIRGEVGSIFQMPLDSKM